MSSTEAATARRWSVGSVLWVIALSIMAGFQLWRGAWVDGVLFGVLVTMLVIDRLTGGRLRLPGLPAAPPWLAPALSAALGIILVFAPRQGWLDLIVIVVIGVGVFLLGWSPAPSSGPARPAAAVRRSMVIWAVLGVALAVWEALAFVFLTSLPQGEFGFPTISVLFDPLVESLPGRILFVGLWLICGLGLLDVTGRRR